MGCGPSSENDRNATGLAATGADIDEAALAANAIDGQTLTSRVELTIKCDKLENKDVLSKSDPFVVVSERRSGAWREIGRTEIVSNNTSPQFVTRIILNYNFEEVQELKFDVYDADTSYSSSDASKLVLEKQDFLGTTETTLAQIFGAAAQTWTGALARGQGTITVYGEELSDQNALVTMHLRAVNLDNKETFSRSDPFLRFSKLREDGTYAPCFKTEVKMNNLNPAWDRFSGSIMQIANGDMFRPLKIECFDWEASGNHRIIGSCVASLNDLMEAAKSRQTGPQRGLPLVNEQKQGKRNYENSGVLFVETFEITPRPSFLDYVRGGMELAFTVAIDFTASNGNPSMPDSLHYVDVTGRTLNQYAQAILAVGRVIEFYDNDKMFPLFGFGGKAPGGSVANHCFALNGDEVHPEVAGVQGILNTYYRSLQLVQLSGPTIFSQIINRAADTARQTRQSQDSQKYHVLLIITDGVINDMDNTIDSIISASGLPLSILIVGVGNADFSAMEVLDSDGKLLQSRTTHRTAARDIVQFVPLSEFKGPGMEHALARELLAEIPEQVLGYYQAHSIQPGVPQSRNQAA